MGNYWLIKNLPRLDQEPMFKPIFCMQCKQSIYSIEEPTLCRDCRIKNNPLTRESAYKAFLDGKTICDTTFYYTMSSKTGYIYGTCGEGTCDMDEENFDEWMKNSFNSETMEIL